VIRTVTARHAATAPALPARVPTIVQDGPLKAPCVGDAEQGAGAGNESCGSQKDSASLYLNQSLPDNPTGIRDVGIESDKFKCAYVPTTPITTCTATPSTGEPR
jgi:hypothetical protein